MKNRFRKPEIVNIKGFDLSKIGSLLKREREYLLEVKYRLTNSIQTLLDLAQQISVDLEISQEEAWSVLNNNGITTTGEDIKVKLLPYLLKLEGSQNQDKTEEEFKNEVVVMLLRSRLKPNHLEEIAPELEEVFDIRISQEDLAHIKEVPYQEYLTDPVREKVCRCIISNLTEDIFGSLLEFAFNEQSQWKKADPDEIGEELDQADPLP